MKFFVEFVSEIPGTLVAKAPEQEFGWGVIGRLQKQYPGAEIEPEAVCPYQARMELISVNIEVPPLIARQLECFKEHYKAKVVIPECGLNYFIIDAPYLVYDDDGHVVDAGFNHQLNEYEIVLSWEEAKGPLIWGDIYLQEGHLRYKDPGA